MKENIEGLFYRDILTKKPIKVRGNLVEDLGEVGREGDIGFYNLKIDSNQKNRQMSVRYCIKELNIKNIGFYYESNVDEVLIKYLALKKAGLPVVPFLRCDKENNFILMPDMTDNGRLEIFDKHLPRPYDFEIKNIKSIKEEALQVANLAFDKNIFLGQDAYAIIADEQTHMGKLCLLDIGRNTQFVNGNYSKVEAAAQVQMFIDFVI